MPKKLADWLEAFSAYDWSDLGWSIGVLLVGALLGRIVAEAIFNILKTWAARTITKVDDAIAEHMRRPKNWLLPLLGIYLVFPLVTLPDGALQWVRHALLISVIIGVGWALAKFVQVIETVVRHHVDVSGGDLRARQIYTQTTGLRNILVFVITVVTIGAVLITFEPVRELGAGLLASAGIAGIVLGFAAQRSIATVIAGVQIALAQPIRVDDVVVVEGEWGRIEEITLTYVVVRIWDLRRLVVPITYFIEKPFQNWTRGSPQLLGAVELRLDYSVPVDDVRAKVDSILEASRYWDRKVNTVQVTDLTDRVMVVRSLFSAKDSDDLWNLRCEVREKLIAYLAAGLPQTLPRIRAELDPKQGAQTVADAAVPSVASATPPE